MEIKKPNFFIVGAARAGTTSLWQYLQVHPKVYMPGDELFKEPTFFSNDGKKRELKDYLSLFNPAAAEHKWVGEASVAYMTDPGSARRIYEFNRSARIIIMLRNPADRAYSLYNWMVQDGYEYVSSFEEALAVEETRVQQRDSDWYKPNYYWGYLYFRSGLYYEQVKRYLELFKNQVLLLKFEDFVKEPGVVYGDVCSFLQVEPVKVRFHIHNPSYAVRSAKILFILRKLNNNIIRKNKQGIEIHNIIEGIDDMYGEIIKKLYPAARLSFYERIVLRGILKKIVGYLQGFSEPFPYRDIKSKEERDRLLVFGLKPGKPLALNRGTRRKLLKKYERDIEKLVELTGMDLSEWVRN